MPQNSNQNFDKRDTEVSGHR